jgi:hypothetical protein
VQSTTRILGSTASPNIGARTQVIWSEEYRETLHRTATGETPPRAPIDPALAQSLLKVADGFFLDAESEILDVLRENLWRCDKDAEIFITLLSALFAVQRFDLVAAMLRDIHGFPAEFEIDVKPGAPYAACLRWEISSSGAHRFTFDPRVFETDITWHEPRKLHWAFPMYAHYAQASDPEIGSVMVNQFDIGVVPGLAWCDSRPDRFLVPDCIYIPTRGYSHARQIYRDNAVVWSDRKPVAFWRGATTGMKRAPEDWRSLERIKLCELARRHEQIGLIDAGISSVIQFNDSAVIRDIETSGLIRGPVPWQEWNRYKYHIDIDGNSSPWSNLFQKLLTASPVLKIESSRNLLQWYYDRLVPWYNYVPVAPDMSDLIDKIKWLHHNDQLAEEIGHRGFELAQELSYEREIARSAPIVSAAFRYFNGSPGTVGPYGRPPSSSDLRSREIR